MKSVLGAACLLCVVVAGAGASRGAEPVDPALLVTFEPVLLFHPDEDWAPERADSFVARARVEKQTARGRWTVVPPPVPTSTRGCTLSPCYRFNLPCSLRSGDACYEKARSTAAAWKHPTIYGRVLTVPAGTPPPPGFKTAPRYLVRYWLFYEFDDWRSAHDRLWQAHEADWESVTIGLDERQQPFFAAYSEHCSGTVRAWPNVTKRGGTHPVVHVALGSHANYFTNTTTSTKFVECLRKYPARARALAKVVEDRLVDRTGTAHATGPGGVVGVAPLEVVPLEPPLPRWASFPGRWSEGQLLWIGRTPRRFTSIIEGGGPATPNWNGTSIPSYWHSSSS